MPSYNTGSSYYSNKEIILRLIWWAVEPVLFLMSPRIFHGWRRIVLRAMGAKVGRKVQIYPSARITYPWLLEIGDRSVISWRVRVYNLGKIKIGADTVISQHAHLCGGDHDYKNGTFTLLRSGLTIGSNVWIAADAFIGPGVTIQAGAVVAARAVVTKDVPAQTLVAGNPASVIKQI